MASEEYCKDEANAIPGNQGDESKIQVAEKPLDLEEPEIEEENRDFGEKNPGQVKNVVNLIPLPCAAESTKGLYLLGNRLIATHGQQMMEMVRLNVVQVMSNPVILDHYQHLSVPL